ncbi:MAG TPA: hypothetical protein PKI03_20910 [Pseudomonadota bacterium]|nr:hypothetical protein [Pseudomonadota bacterium]
MPLRTLLLFVSALAACHSPIPDPDPPSVDLGCPSPPDLATPAAKCAAAKGLSGDNLLCVDFKDIQATSNAELNTALPGWEFYCFPQTFTWTTSGGLLQVGNFATFNSECTVYLPPISLNDPDKQAYKSVMLSLVHRVDLVEPEQNARIFLNESFDQTRLMYLATGKRNPPRQMTTITLEVSELPARINNTPKWILKLSAEAMGGRQGWQIDSIAVQGVR